MALLTDIGASDVEPGGRGKNLKNAIVEVTTVKLLCFLCHRKDNNYAYTFAAGCIQNFLILFELLEFVCI